MENKRDELTKVLSELMAALYPEATLRVVLAPDFEIDDTVDPDDFIEAAKRTTRRLNSRWLGWFWRWYYRPKPWQGVGRG